MNNNQQQQPDTGMEAIWMMVLVGIAALLLWFLAKTYIVGAVFGFRLYVTGPILALFDHDIADTMRWMDDVPYDQVDWEDFVNVSLQFGRWTRFPVFVVCCGLAYYIYAFHPLGRFRRKWDMFTLPKQEVALWPCITPVLDANLLKQPQDKGRWAWGATPKDWLTEKGLWEHYEEEEVDKFNPKRKLKIKKRRPNREKVEEALIAQLGPRFTSFDVLPQYMKALLGAFMAKACGEGKVCQKILNKMSMSSVLVGVATNDLEEKLDLTAFDMALGLSRFEKYKNSDLVKEVLARHYYLSTVMVALLVKARMSGVLASAEFLWLKPVQRTLFYMFNTLGRRVCWVTAAGIFGHYYAELRRERGLRRPYIVKAYEGITEYLADFTDDMDQKIEVFDPKSIAAAIKAM